MWLGRTWLILLATQAISAISRRHHHPHHNQGGGCPNCLLEGEEAVERRREELRLEAIKRQILSKLGLAVRPNVSSTALPKELVLETVNRAEEGTFRTQARVTPAAQEGLDETSEIIAFAEPGSQVNGQTLLEFPFPSSSAEGSELRVKSATLWLRLNHRRSSPPDYNITFWVFRVLLHLPNATVLNSKEFDLYTEMSSSKVMTGSGSGGWQKLDMTAAVGSWYGDERRDRLRLLVDCSGCGRLITPQTFGSGPKSRPFLVVRTEPASTRRVRRRALDCSGAKGGQCCKQRFYVSFKQLGWDDWVIAPSGYYANYCRGDCSAHRTPDMFVNHYTQVIEEYRKTDRLAGLQPCCAPVRFSSASLIYYGPDMNIIKRDLPKMVVEECGCP